MIKKQPEHIPLTISEPIRKAMINNKIVTYDVAFPVSRSIPPPSNDNKYLGQGYIYSIDGTVQSVQELEYHFYKIKD